jgi:hypothetical protein
MLPATFRRTQQAVSSLDPFLRPANSARAARASPHDRVFPHTLVSYPRGYCEMSGEARDANAAQRRYWNTVAGPRWVASPEFRERRNQESMALLLEFLFSADEPHGPLANSILTRRGTLTPGCRLSVSPRPPAGVTSLREVHFALGPKGPAKSWTSRSVADAKRSATRNSSGASCYQAPSWLVDDNLHLGSASNAVK